MLSMDLAGTHVNAVGGWKPVALGFLPQERRFVVGKITAVADRSAAGPRRRHARAVQRLSASGKPLNGTCMTSAGAGGGSVCDSCNFADDKTSFLREETKRHGFPTPDGVHMGPCQIHREHSHTIGPDG